MLNILSNDGFNVLKLYFYVKNRYLLNNFTEFFQLHEDGDKKRRMNLFCALDNPDCFNFIVCYKKLTVLVKYVY